MPSRVLVTVPNVAGWIHKRVARTLFSIAGDRRFEVEIRLPSLKPYANNLHHCILMALESGADFLLTMDADNPPPPNVLDLCELGLDVVGCPTPVWHSGGPKGDRPWYLNAMVDVGEDGFRPLQDVRPEDCHGLAEVDAIGSGCLVISRRVLEAVPAPFHRTWNEDGTQDVGGDFSACRRWRAAGFRVFAHFSYAAQHFCELELSEVIHCFADMRTT